MSTPNTTGRQVTRIETPPSWGHPADVVPLQAALAVKDATDPIVVAWRQKNVGNPPTKLEAARRLLEAVARTVEYRKDPPGTQYVLAPRHTVADGVGDCKKMSTLIASAAHGLGIPYRFAVVAQRNPDDPNHVWAELLTEGGWTAVDPVPRPLALGRRVDGRIEVWDGYPRKEGKTMQTIPIRNSRAIPVRRSNPCGKCGGCGLAGLGADISTDTVAQLAQAAQDGNVGGAVDTIRGAVQRGGGNWENAAKKIAEGACAAGLTATGYGAALAPLCKLIGPIWDAIKKWITVKINPQRDFYEAAKKQIPALAEPGAYKRFKLFYADKKKDQMDARKALLGRDGWNPVWEWSKHYGEAWQVGSGKGTYYGAVWDRNTMPQALKDRMEKTGARNLRMLMLPAADLPGEARALMAETGAAGFGVPQLPLDFDGPASIQRYREIGARYGIVVPTTIAPDSLLMKNDGYEAIRSMFTVAPAAPAAPSSSSPSSSTVPVRPPAGRSPWPTTTTRPGAAAPSSGRTQTAARPAAPAGLPAGARPVTPPLPPGSRVVAPPATSSSRSSVPAGLSTEEASLVAAVRQAQARTVASRAAQAADYFVRGDLAGLGASGSSAYVEIVPLAKALEILRGLPARQALLDSKDAKRRAAETNYGLSHLNSGMTPQVVASRLMAFKKALGISDPGGAIVNDGFRAFLAAQGGFPVGAVPTVAKLADALGTRPTGTAPSSSSSVPSPTQAEAAAAAAGMPEGSRQVSPPVTAPAADTTGAGTAALDPAAAAAAGVPAGSTQVSPAQPSPTVIITPPAPSSGSDFLPGIIVGALLAAD